LKNLKLPPKVTLLPEYQFPKQIDSGLKLKCSSVAVGGSTICSSKQEFYSTLGVLMADFAVGVTASHAVAQLTDSNTETVYNEGVKVKVWINNHVEELGMVVQRDTKNDLSLIVPTTNKIPILSNYIHEIGVVSLPNADEIAEIHKLVLKASENADFILTVQKYGASTGLTNGIVERLDEDGQIEIRPLVENETIAAHGDSGACWIINNYLPLRNRIIGIHVSSSTTSKMNKPFKRAFAVPCWVLVQNLREYVNSDTVM